MAFIFIIIVLYLTFNTESFNNPLIKKVVCELKLSYFKAVPGIVNKNKNCISRKFYQMLSKF